MAGLDNNVRVNLPSPFRVATTWKISISQIAVHVYRSPRGLWIKEFGAPWPQEWASKKTCRKKAQQLAARYTLRILTE